MTRPIHQKVTASHLRRDAYLYVRQSTVRQVFENTESTRRQYALRERAVALGWPIERVNVIDSDLGKSGASSADREGFQKLVGEVGMGHAGIVLGLEVSRLARNSTDWHRLLEICALTDTLILDEDGIYNPSDFNDRLLLGLKGTMSDAELHVLRARLRGGILNQARRGALKSPLPVGLVYDPAGNVALDPDNQVRHSIAHLFETFARTGSASATVRHFRTQELRFPRRPRGGPHKGELLWEELRHWRVLRVLHNPRYAGTFFFGRSRTHKRPGDRIEVEVLPRDEWTALLLDAHPGYISWEQFEANLTRLRDNAQANGSERRKSPPREGPALLQGLAICGVCGQRMTVRYHTRKDRLWPEYICQREGIDTATAICQSIPGLGIEGVPTDEFFWGVLSLVLLYSAYVSEVYRAGIDSVHPSQEAAARSLGLTRFQALRFVVVPQAVRRVIPPLLNDFIGLQKDTALVGLLGLVEAFRRADIEAAAAFNFTPYVATAILFLLLTIPLSRFVDWLVARDRRRQMAGAR